MNHHGINILNIVGDTELVAPKPGNNTTGIMTVGGTKESNLIPTVNSIINGVIGVLGVVCVVVMIIGGVNYMISQGDPGKVKKAKDTILYGLIGLVICVLAFMIVNFVIVNILGGGAPTTTPTTP